MTSNEFLIIRSLIETENYIRKVLPFLMVSYFDSIDAKLIFQEIQNFMNKYNTLPTYNALMIVIKDRTNITEKEEEITLESLKELSDCKEPQPNLEWLVDITEKFCKDKAIFIALADSIAIMDGKSKKEDRGNIPELLQKALSVCFDTNVGHDYLKDSDARFDFYHKQEDQLRFDIEFLNKVTAGGLPNKTLNVFMGGCVDENTPVRVRLTPKSREL